MKKYVFSGILGISIIAVVSLVFLAAEKPSPRYTWKAVILDSSLNMTGGYGGVYDSINHGWVYNDSDEFANVRVGIRTYVATKFKTTHYEPVLVLEVLSPAQIGLQGITAGAYSYDPDLIHYCGFPNTQGGELPTCWGAFLNQPHPQTGYQAAQFQHFGERFMTEAEADITLMASGETRVMHLSMYLEGQDIYGGTCDECDPADYHYVQGHAHGWDKYAGSYPPYDIYLTRIDENKWKVVVNTEFDNPTRQDHFDEYPFYTSYDPEDPAPDRIWESYCECVYEKVRKREVLTRKIRQSSWVKAPIVYEMLFIRTPK